MNNYLEKIPDEDVLRVLVMIVRGHLKDEPRLRYLSTELKQSLATEVGSDYKSLSATEGDVARSALKLLSIDPHIAKHIQALSESPPENFLITDRYMAKHGKMPSEAPLQEFVVSETIMVSALALAVLQIKGYVSYDKKNGFQFKLEKKTASDLVLKSFIEKFLSFISKQGK